MDTKKKKQLLALGLFLFVGFIAVTIFSSRPFVTPIPKSTGLTIIFLSPTPSLSSTSRY